MSFVLIGILMSDMGGQHISRTVFRHIFGDGINLYGICLRYYTIECFL